MPHGRRAVPADRRPGGRGRPRVRTGLAAGLGARGRDRLIGQAGQANGPPSGERPRIPARTAPGRTTGTRAGTSLGVGGRRCLCLQPALTAMDVLTALRSSTGRQIIAYSTSGEYAALKALGPGGAAEYLGSLKRAGADLILSFAAADVAHHLGVSRAHTG
ncbi:hypothetical protein [Streptomyces sp. NPDC101115]|uniref:hypothetical protein n=1 Tax=Streptomyces sp. NPDC101115 TaxID=3366106 RepID=UPI00382CE1C7